jgi:photosystem II stability/assembly factor-like uncharacterized protein
MKKLLVLLLTLSFCAALSAQTKSPILSGEEKVKMFSTHLKMKKESSFKGLEWQYIGPANISGRCTDVEAVMPRGKSYTIWIGSATGGVWKSDNEGTSFEHVSKDMPTASIGDLAIDPNNPEVIWVGTGEANIFRSSNSGCGVFKTSDGGKTWKDMGLNNTMTIGRIRVHPLNSDIVYVAATGHEWTANEERGLFKTEDGGNSWEKVLYIDDMTGVYDLVIDPDKPNTIYCTTWERMREKWNDPRTWETTKNSAIWKSTDGGKNWKKIINGLPAPNHLGRIGIDIARSNTKVLYAYVDNYEITTYAEEGEQDAYGRQKSNVIKGATIYRSGNAGDSWVKVSGLTPDQKRLMERHSGTYGWVFAQIRVDPSDENTVYTMGLGLNQSIDGGKTFKPLRGPHSDHHGLWIDPNNPNYLLNVQDGGLAISYDRGKTFKIPLKELPLGQFFNISYDMATPFRVYGSMQDHGSYVGTVDLSMGRGNVPARDFGRMLGGEGTSHAIDLDDNNTVYASGFYGLLMKAKVEDYVNSSSYRVPSKRILPAQFKDEPVLRGQWITPTKLSPHNQDIVFHGMQRLLMSKDRGKTWEYISDDLTYNDPDKIGDISYQTITTLDESSLKAGLIYVGTDDGRVWRTRDGGKNWSDIRKKNIPVKWVSRIVASKFDPGTVYMTQTGRRDDDFQIYIWKSTDFGDTWTDISANIPLGPINVLREDPINKEILYVGSDAGVYVSVNGGQSYEVLGNLPYEYVHDLIVHPRDNMVVIGTHGGGVFVLDANEVNDKNKVRRRF